MAGFNDSARFVLSYAVVGDLNVKLLSHRLYHPDFFHVEDLVVAYEQLSRTLIVFWVGILVSAICYALSPVVGMGAGVVFYAGFFGTGYSAIKLSAKGLRVPEWTLVLLHVASSAVPPFAFINVLCIRRLIRRGLIDFSISPTWFIDRDQVRLVQRPMIGKQFVGYDLIS